MAKGWGWKGEDLVNSLQYIPNPSIPSINLPLPHPQFLLLLGFSISMEGINAIASFPLLYIRPSSNGPIPLHSKEGESSNKLHSDFYIFPAETDK
jgi:hypothetical protein